MTKRAVTMPRPAQGTLELLPREQIAFNRMVDVIRRHFEGHGFLPLQTPAFERTDVLLTKGGGETENQVYFVQSTGALEKSRNSEQDEVVLPDLALRFDLTVPTARYVAQHENELTFPFRRYQIQPVYRGERPQRGRYREFLQCDIDIIGKGELSVRHDAEPPAAMHAIFTELAIGEFTIHLNNRKLLRGFLAHLGLDHTAQPAVLREVDKLDKRGEQWLRDRLTDEDLGLSREATEELLRFVSVRTTTHAEAIGRLTDLEGREPDLDAGIAECREVLEVLRAIGVPESDYCLNFSVARGLDYYTGTVYETFLDQHPELGSICSGGRYEDLAGQYTASALPGVGMSIGLSRLFWQLREAGLVDDAESTVQVLVTLMAPDLAEPSLALAGDLRRQGMAVEAIMEPMKLAKQFRYADRAGIRFVVVLGEDELDRNVVTIRDLVRGDQFEVDRPELASSLRVELAQPVVTGTAAVD